MRDVSEWLEDLGLGEHKAAFAENGIDFELLAELTNDDLKDLGVGRLAERKKLLKAIATLSKSVAEVAPRDAGRAALTPHYEAERRHLTVMFCDLVGSTALSAKLDPEDMGTVIRSYQACCTEVINRWEGYLAKYMGDGILAYFGYPSAHEDDAERAVRAALEVTEVVGNLTGKDNDRLAARVGIATGLVMVGELIGEGAAQEEAVVGETPNLAARLQGLAAPGSVVIADATWRLVAGLFDCEDLGPQQMKGLSEAVPAHRVIGESPAAGRFEAAAARGLTPLVGRGEEVDLLIKRWGQAKDGEGQAVLLSGEAGIGKSRIVSAFCGRIEAEPHDRVHYYCSPFHSNSALHPAIEQLARELGFVKSEGEGERLDKLETALAARRLAVPDMAPLLAPLLSLPAEERYSAIEVSSQLRRRRSLEALLAFIEAKAAETPLLVVVEDAHWIDPSTLEMIGLLIERLKVNRVLLLIICRPEFEPPWAGHALLTSLRLNRLSRRESAAIVANVAGRKSLPEEVLDQIVARTDGVALFIEELTKTVLESDLFEQADDACVLKGPLPALAIPASLHDSLMARLDRLGAVKDVAQLAATLGRSFSHELLAAVSPLDGAALAAALDRLEAAELVYRRSVAPDVVYEFKHALVQDAAYQSLLKSRRQRHHDRIAEVLEASFPETVEAHPELLAHHYSEAGLAARGIDYWLKAGQQAMQRSSHFEAEGHLKKGLELLDRLDDVRERQRREIDLQNALGVCLMPIRGFSNPEVADAFSRAASISEEVGDDDSLFVALRGHGNYFMISGDLRVACEHTHRILDLAANLDNRDYLIEAHHLGWTALCYTGDYVTARGHAEAGIALYDRDQDHHLTYTYSGHDPGMCCRIVSSQLLTQLGYPDQALSMSRDGMALAQELGHPFTMAVALWGTGILHLLRREQEAARETGETTVEYCEEKGIPPIVPVGRAIRGAATAQLGDAAEGIAELRQGVDQLRSIGFEFGLPSFYAVLGEVCGRAGQIEDGLAAIEDGLAMADRNADNFNLPELHRVKGDLLLARSAGNGAEAASCFQQAMKIAAGQQAKLLKLRAAVSLARLWAEDGRRGDAYALLAPVRAWFTEGFDMADLKAAKTLLDELS